MLTGTSTVRVSAPNRKQNGDALFVFLIFTITVAMIGSGVFYLYAEKRDAARAAAARVGANQAVQLDAAAHSVRAAPAQASRLAP